MVWLNVSFVEKNSRLNQYFVEKELVRKIMKKKTLTKIFLLLIVMQLLIIPVAAGGYTYNFDNIRYNYHNSAYINGYEDGYDNGYNEHIISNVRYNIYDDDYIKFDYNEYTGMFFIDTKYNLEDRKIVDYAIGFVLGICFTFFVAYLLADKNK